MMDTILLLVILLTGFYMAWNIGANDVANAMGTSVGSGALTLKHAVIIAAILEFCGAFFFGSNVSETMQSGIIDPEHFAGHPRILVYGMLAALASAGLWLQIASYYGWPVSTTHAIVGAIVGFGVVVGGLDSVYWQNVTFIVTSWVLSPVLGGLLGYLIFVLLRKQIFYQAEPVEAAKKLTPLLVFILLTILGVVFVTQGLKNVNLDLSGQQRLILVLSIATSGSLLSYLFVKRIPSPNIAPTRGSHNAHLNYSIEKALKHLKKVQTSSEGEIQYHTGLILQEIESLSQSIDQAQDIEEVQSQYLKVEKIFGFLQIITACMMAFAHGANDVANAIGPLSAAVTILTTGFLTLEAPIPAWALALGGTGIVIGLATWGWRVIETIGRKITELTPSRGFSAEFGAAVTIVLASYLGMPISTTHTLVGAVMGVGFARGLEAVNLSTTRDIFISWIFTVPIGGAIAIVLFYLIQFIFG